jgi:23S rRNA pseudouridine1911/1915/1917 synthase
MEIRNFSVIYQDHHLLIVNKPPGVVIHPTYKHADGTMWNALLEYLEQQGGDDWQPSELPDPAEWARAPEEIQAMLRARRRERQWQEEGLLPRPCLLHRLDKDTSGVVALTRTERSRRHLIRQFYEHTVVKRYLTLVRKGANEWSRPRTNFDVVIRRSDGNKTQLDSSFDLLSLDADELLLNGPLQRDPGDRRRCIVGPDGQESRTLLRLLSVQDGFALLEVRPITGRTHQIRAHLAALGYALVGDQVYASPAEVGTPDAALRRQFLHAYSLELRRYPDNVLCTFVAPLADDLVFWLERYAPALLNAVTLPSP